jgi:hypothetical protein
VSSTWRNELEAGDKLSDSSGCAEAFSAGWLDEEEL